MHVFQIFFFYSLGKIPTEKIKRASGFGTKHTACCMILSSTGFMSFLPIKVLIYLSLNHDVLISTIGGRMGIGVGERKFDWK